MLGFLLTTYNHLTKKPRYFQVHTKCIRDYWSYVCFVVFCLIFCSSYGLYFTYVDEHNNPVHLKRNAHQREYNLDGEVNLPGYRIRCIYEDLIISGVSYRIDWSSSG